MYEPTQLEIAEIFLRVLCDKRPKKADALFIHGTLDDPRIDRSIIEEASNVWNAGLCDKIVLNGLTPSISVEGNHGYYGYENLLKMFLSKGIPKEDILLIVPSEHTSSEAENILRMAKDRNWNSLIIMSMPYHQIRCFLSTVSAMERLNIHINIYNNTYRDVDWNMVVKRRVLNGLNVLGQRDEEGPFISLMKNEFERLERYAVEGEGYSQIATIREALEYLEKRDLL